jgi:flagellar hook-basal body complex protein FliE
MAIAPIKPPMTALADVEPLARSEGASGGPFAKVVDQLLGDASNQQAQADQAVRDLIMGRTDNLHSVMLAVAKADLSFRMILEVRNRLTEAFQEIMRMQV